MAAHSHYAPSSATRNMECPGNLALADSLPEIHRSVAGEAAMLGTAAHAVVERCLKTGKESVDFRDWIVEVTDDSAYMRKNNVRPIHGGRVFEVDTDIIDGADVAVSYVRDRCDELGVDESTLQLETRTNPLPEREDASGTADITIDAWPDVLEVVDYKNGYRVVDHTKKGQLVVYLLGKAIETGFTHSTYRVTVVQPNAQHEDGRVRPQEYSKAELLAFQKEYRKALLRCDEAKDSESAPVNHKKVDSDWAEAYLKAGDHCTFCDAEAVCPMRRNFAQLQAQMDFAEDPPEPGILQSEEDVARILAWRPYFNSLFSAAEAFAMRSLGAGYDVPGFKIVSGRSTRKFRPDMSEKEIITAIKRGKFLGAKALPLLYTKPKLISAPQAVALVDKKRRQEFERLLVVKPEGRPTLASEDDPREAVLVSVSDDFDEIEDEWK